MPLLPLQSKLFVAVNVAPPVKAIVLKTHQVNVAVPVAVEMVAVLPVVFDLKRTALSKAVPTTAIALVITVVNVEVNCIAIGGVI